MHPAYLETHFQQQGQWDDWPARFAIITAYATTGKTWPTADNQAADRRLAEELRGTSRWLRRLTGYSPSSGHAEPGWAVELDFQEACDIGRRYRQDAIYYVIHDTLYLSFCDQRRALREVGLFRPRVHGGTNEENVNRV